LPSDGPSQSPIIAQNLLKTAIYADEQSGPRSGHRTKFTDAAAAKFAEAIAAPEVIPFRVTPGFNGDDRRNRSEIPGVSVGRGGAKAAAATGMPRADSTVAPGGTMGAVRLKRSEAERNKLAWLAKVSVKVAPDQRGPAVDLADVHRTKQVDSKLAPKGRSDFLFDGDGQRASDVTVGKTVGEEEIKHDLKAASVDGPFNGAAKGGRTITFDSRRIAERLSGAWYGSRPFAF
jgi:hypothetical protein